MKKLWIGIGLLILSNSLFAATPTMKYSSQPTGTVFSLPASFGLTNLAPVPEDLCSPTVSTDAESATCSGLPVCKSSQMHTASFTCSVTTSCNHTVPASKAGGSCTIFLSVIKPGTLPASTPFSFRIRYGSYDAMLNSDAFALNGTNPLPPADAYRTITFKNSCSSSTTIWFGSITGAAPTKHVLTGGGIDCAGGDAAKAVCVARGGACYSRIGAPDACLSQACSSDSECVTGASCIASKNGNKCFWVNPTPANQSFQLSGAGGTNTIKIPEYKANGLGVVWSGAFGGRTGCTTGACLSALCTSGGANAQGVCSPGVGFQQPATQAEPTFTTYATGITPALAPDAYDVTLINGANVPMSMFPTNEPVPASGNPYTCGAAGFNQNVPVSSPSGNTIGASSWAISTNQANLAYRYVVSSSTTPARCSADSDCATGQNCGLNYSAESIGSTAAPGSGFLVCGIFAGWFTADQICGTNNNFTTATALDGTVVENFQCNATVTLGKMFNLYQCNSAYDVSCYSSTSADCCGCVNWSSQGTTVLVPSNTAFVAACEAENTTWTGSFTPSNQPQVYDTILFLKQSCPSCYAYPFDDKSSSFTCSNGDATTTNTVDYTVEFCPGGNGSTNFQPPPH